MWTRKELKIRAKAVLRVSYWKAFLVSIIIAIVGGNNGCSFNYKFGSSDSNNISNSYSGGSIDEFLPYLLIGFLIVSIIVLAVLAFRIFLGYHLEVGGRRFFIRSAQNDADLNVIGFAFDKTKYFDIVKAMLWRGFLNFLWYLLLIIPGIIKSYAYRMVPYILADNPNIGYKRSVTLSRQMTRGHKLRMFILDLSFVGWYILGFLALIVGILFVMPYVNATQAELYLVLRQNAIDKGLTNSEELRLS